jgi:hypothetical protein
MRTLRTAIAAALLVAGGVAIGQEPEFDGHCAMSAALGNRLPTSCSVVWISPQTNKLYCFSSQAAKAAFMRNPEANEQSAQAFWKDPAFWEKRQKERGDGG